MSTTGLGIAALVLGVLALSIAWIPIIGMLGVPLAGIGVILGIAGMIMVGLGYRTGMPISAWGTGISLFSIFLAFFATNNRSSVRNQSGPPGPPPPPAIDMTHTTGPFVPKVPDFKQKENDFNTRIEEIKRQAREATKENK